MKRNVKIWWRSLILFNLLGSSIGVQAVLADSVVDSKFVKHASEGKLQNTTVQVTSVSQLSDVQPTDWAFTALQSLVERYGCIAGFPNGAFRGNRALSRFEFAAGLNACLDKIYELISTGLADKVGKEDLVATLPQLQTQFAIELSALKGRVDGLKAKTATLEAQEVSTTTKLSGQIVLAISGDGSSNANILLPNNTPSGNAGSANTTAIARVRLELNTTFTGDDLLVTRLQTGNGGSNIGSFLDGIFAKTDLAYAGTGSNVTLGILRYDFSPIKDVRIAIGPQIDLSDKLDLNSYANDESKDFSSGVFINNPLILPLNSGAGAVVEFNPSGGAFSIRAGYIAGNGVSPSGSDTDNVIGGNLFAASSSLTNGGLAGDPYQATVELEFAPKDSGFAARLQYTNAAIGNLDFNIGGVNLEWAINSSVAIFGRFGFGGVSDRISTINPYTWSAGIAFPDLFRSGSLAAIAIGQPFIDRTVGNSTQTNIEAFFKFPLGDNLSITPDLQFIINGNNNINNGLITIGTLRTVFTF